jgi:hypothetical protein
MAEQEKLFLTELRLCGESNHWRVDARYTCAEKKQDDDDHSSKQQDKEEKKPTALPQEVTLSILVPSGDRSVVDVQIDAMERAIALLQATVNAARAEQLKHADSGRA